MFNFENESKQKEDNSLSTVDDSHENVTDTEDNIQDPSLPIEDSHTVSSENSSAGKKRKLQKDLLDYLEIFVFAVAFVIVLFSFVFRICTVDGDSMMHTLYEDETVVVSNLFYEPKPEDIVVFHQTGALNEPVVKRVIAVAGETVNIRYTYESMTVSITDKNGNVRVLEESYALYEGVPLYLSPYTATVPEGCVFVMGDNRNNSMDSRNPTIGMVDTRRILGKVVLRLTPFSRMGSVS